MSVSTIPAKNMNSYIGKDNIIIIDLRSKNEYINGHIPTAINVPYEEFLQRKIDLKTNNVIILYCERGNLSLLASRQLSNQGYRVISIYGGIHAYRGELCKEN